MANAKVRIEFGQEKSWSVLCTKCGVVADDDGKKFNSQFAILQADEHRARHARRDIRARLAARERTYA